MTEPGSLRARRQAVRNLRAAPSLLTPVVIDRLMFALAMARPAPTAHDVTLWPVADRPAPPTSPEAAKPASLRTKRKAKATTKKPAGLRADRAARPGAEPLALPAPAPAPVVTPEPESHPMMRQVPIVRPKPLVRAMPTVARLDARTPSVMEQRRSAPAHDASAAVAWLRSHGVSVKAESTTVFGTRWLVSNEFGALSTEQVVAIARKKGFGA